MRRYVQVITTTSKRNIADKIARNVVKERMAACAQVMGPVESTYRWKGRVVVSKEWLCLIKTEDKHYKRLEKAIKSMHNYSIPEILSFSIANGNEDYLNWMSSSVKSKK